MCIQTELIDSFSQAEKINVYNEGEVSVFYAGSNGFNEILTEWEEMIKNARDMPAYGVSLNKETEKAKESGVWVEFVFGSVFESNGMPYEKLLINVDESFQGFNLIRFNSKIGYDGRCFYFDLVGKDMSNFYKILLSL